MTLHHITPRRTRPNDPLVTLLGVLLYVGIVALACWAVMP